MKRFIFFATYTLYFTCNLGVSAQDNPSKPDKYINLSTKIEKASDSLLERTYEELESLFKKNINDSVLSNIYVNTYLKKAKNENDSLQMANGYLFASRINSNYVEIEYLDSLINVSKNLNSTNYPGLGYLIKGVCYYDLENYKKAIENYLIAQEYADTNNNIEHQIAIKHNVGLLKNAIDAHKEALIIFKENLEFIKTQDTINEYPHSHITTLFAIADSYHRMNLGDSATYYVNKGLDKSYNNKNKYKYTDFLLLSGINNFMLKKYQKSLDTLLKASKRIQDFESYNPNKAYCFIQIGRALQKLGKKEEGFSYLKKADSIITPNNYTDEKRVAYELLIDHYKDIGDIDNQLKMMSKLIIFDSIYYAKNKNIKSDIITKYDTALLIDERNDIINQLR
ncbi:tetratricopeptide repeat protein [Aquimarina celericrescens]|uniref:Tetratricopeptide repeat protein n=1 Tax=Aquimarina celericrescens TaxID=1964542 RepID=A0ABW5AW65_9FLAO|nr:hypothetical protein [Aquimarina celericrescens]